MNKIFYIYALCTCMLISLYAKADGVEIPIVSGTTSNSVQLSFSWANPNDATKPMWLTSSPDGEVYFVKAENQPAQYAAWNVDPVVGETWQMGSEGTEVTCQVFYLRNATTGLYMKMADEGTGLLWNDLGNNKWERKLYSTTDQSEALKLTLVPAEAYTDYTYTPSTYLLLTTTDMRQDNGETALDSHWGIAAHLESGENWRSPWLASRKYERETFAYSGDMCATVTQVTHNLIDDLTTLYSQLSAIDVATTYPSGTALGQYDANKVSAFTNMLNNSSLDETMNSMDGDHTDATVWNWIGQLHNAYNDMIKAKNQIKLNGYYRFVSVQKNGDDEMYMYDHGGDREFWCEKSDPSNISEIWRLEYDETTGKTLMYNLETSRRMRTDYPYVIAWGIFVDASYDGMVRIDYAGDVDGENAFWLRTNKQPYGYGDVLYANDWTSSWFIGTGTIANENDPQTKWYIREVTDIDVADDYTLVDQQPYTAIAPTFVKNFHYTRKMNNTGMQALYLPVSMPVESFTNQDVDVYFINDNRTYFDAEGNMTRTTMEVVPITAGTLIANTPYIIKAKTTGEKDFSANAVTLLPAQSKSVDCSSTTYNFTFTGTYESIPAATLKSNKYYYLSGGALIFDENNTYPLSPERWYMTMDSRGGQYVPKPSEVKVVIAGQEDLWDETGIEFTEEETTKSAAIYDLSGRKVATPTQRGIYIQNGRKVLVR